MPLQAGVSALGQARYALSHPSVFLGALWHSLSVHIRDHFPEFIGQLGWLDVALPSDWFGPSTIALVGAGLTDKVPGLAISRGRRAFALGLAAAGGLAILVMIYAFWNPVGSPGIEGVQGRYFIPFGPLVFLALYNLRLPPLLQRLAARPARPDGLRRLRPGAGAIGPRVAVLRLALRPPGLG